MTDDTLPPLPEPDAWTVAGLYYRTYDSIPTPLLPPFDSPEPLYSHETMGALIDRAVAQERAKWQAEADDDAKSRDLMRDILQRTAVALKGPEHELTRWGWEDLPEVAARAVAEERERCARVCEAIVERDEYAYADECAEAIRASCAPADQPPSS